MSLLTSGAGGILTPEEVGELVVRPVSRLSVAYTVSQVAVIGSHEMRIPILSADPTAAFVAEGQEIPADDAEVSELIVTPKKVAGLSVISKELATDSDPSAQDVVGQALARDTARAVDAAFFGTTTANGPSGLGALAGISEVDAGTINTLDAFAEGQSLAENVGAVIVYWVASPSSVLSLAQLKRDGLGSNEPLLQPDPTKPGRRQIFGAPLLSSPAVADHEIWGIPASAIPEDPEDQSGRLSYVVQAQDASLDVDASVFFTSDRVAIRTTLRVAFGWPHPAAVVRIEHGGS